MMVSRTQNSFRLFQKAKTASCFLFFLLVLPSFSQDTEAIGKVEFKTSHVGDESSFVGAGYVGWQWKTDWMVGVGANFLITKIDYQQPGWDKPVQLEMVSAGVINEKQFDAFGNLFWAINLYTGVGYLNSEGKSGSFEDHNETDFYIALEPGMLLVCRLRGGFALTAGVSYHLPVGIDHSVYENQDFRGVQFGIGMELNMR